MLPSGTPHGRLFQTPYSILPHLTSAEDVFHTLGVAETAADLSHRGFNLAQVALELGFGPDLLHLRLTEVAKQRVATAVQSGFLTPDQARQLLADFDHLAIKWVEVIFFEERTAVAPSEAPSTTYTTEYEEQRTRRSVRSISKPLSKVVGNAQAIT